MKMACKVLSEKSDDLRNRRSLERMLPMYIRNYFQDKEIPAGVDITSQKYIDLCIDTNMCDASDRAYSALAESGRFQDSDDHSISEDIRFVIAILAKMKRHVPQEFSAGMLLMHLELVEGLSFSTEI
jgi:hypothetical protein